MKHLPTQSDDDVHMGAITLYAESERLSTTIFLRACAMVEMQEKMARHETVRQRRYLSYLLRLWLANDAGKPAWRSSLEDPNTGSRLGFADLSSLFEYLQRETESQSSEPGDQERQD